jgi:FAD-dependent urate hydroxylase
VLVAGAGIGGLATAIALRQAGIDVTVFERAPDLRELEVGLGIHMWQNATRALRILGVDTIEAVGESMERMEWRNASGRFLAAWNVGDLGRKLGAPAVGLVRSQLQAALAARVEDGVVRTGSELVDFREDGSGVVAHFADGSEERGDVLVGADGLHSLVRARLHGSREPTYAGYMIWNATVELPDGLVPPQVFRETWGPGARFGFFPVGRRTYWFCIARAPAGGSDPPGGRKAAVLARCRGWAKPTGAVIEAHARGGDWTRRHRRARPARALGTRTRDVAGRRSSPDDAEPRTRCRASDRGRSRSGSVLGRTRRSGFRAARLRGASFPPHREHHEARMDDRRNRALGGRGRLRCP